MEDFIYERSVAPCGIAVEEIYGADDKSAKVWKLFAMQIFSEAEGDYRSMEHLANGTPVLDGIPQRISVAHTSHHLAVATIPKTPDINLEEVNIRTAIGIDIEDADRRQVLKVASKFLTADEMALLPDATIENPEVTTAYILAWTCKEALYKAAMGTAKDWKEDYHINSLPELAADIKGATPEKYGGATVRLSETERMELMLSSWQSEGQIVTVAFSTKIPMYK